MSEDSDAFVMSEVSEEEEDGYYYSVTAEPREQPREPEAKAVIAAGTTSLARDERLTQVFLFAFAAGLLAEAALSTG